jgi:type IV pilus assembly protein PilB
VGNLWDWLAARFGDRSGADARERAEAKDPTPAAPAETQLPEETAALDQIAESRRSIADYLIEKGYATPSQVAKARRIAEGDSAETDLSDFMLEKGYASFEQVEAARGTRRSTDQDLVKILIDMGLNPRDVYESKAQELQVPFVDLTVYKPDSSALNVVPEHVAKRHNILPIKKDGNTLYVAMSDFGNITANNDIRLASGCVVRGVLAVPEAIADSFARVYRPAAGESAGRQDDAKPADETPAGTVLDADMIATMSHAMAEYGAKFNGPVDWGEADDARDQRVDDAPIVRLANTIIQQAIKERASDVHIEPDRRGIRIRFRIDGDLREVIQIPKFIQAPLIQRYRVMADFDLATHRGKPQQGNIRISYLEKQYLLHVNATPAQYGDKLTFKIADADAVRGLNKSGLTPESHAGLEYLAQQPSGLLLFAGPHGSGRSTTQYALLNKLNSVDRHVLTIEPYSSYRLPGVTQVDLRQTHGLTAGEVWRAARDVDVLHIERVCDAETAELAVSAAEAGTLVLAVVDAPDAIAALSSLAEFSVTTDRIGRAVAGVLAQRLVRKICSGCKEVYEVEAREMRRFGFRPINGSQTVQLARGLGCEACCHTGYRGRLGLFELLTMNVEVAGMIAECGFGRRLEDVAKGNGMQSLRQDGLLKILEGSTTPDEVMRVLTW